LAFLTFFPLVIIAIIIRKLTAHSAVDGRFGAKYNLFWVTLAFSILLVVIVILADANRLPAALAVVYSFKYGDKVGHFLLIGLLNFLVALTFSVNRSTRIGSSIVLWSGLVGILVAIEEASQTFFPARTASWGDLLASFGGIIIFGWLAYRLRKRQIQLENRV
jgi:VanZ family protein